VAIDNTFETARKIICEAAVQKVFDVKPMLSELIVWITLTLKPDSFIWCLSDDVFNQQNLDGSI
jgi:hypothetical protein